MSAGSPPTEDPDGHELRVFRRTVLCYPPLLIAYYLAPALPALDAAFLTDDAYGVASYNYAGALLQLPVSSGLLLLAVQLAALVGMYSLAAHARLLFLLVTIFGIVLSLVSGMYVASPVSSTLAYIVNVAQGGILFLAYTGPLSRRFH